MEHPTGDFDTAIQAMENAVLQLRSLPHWEKWITFCAQGEGSSIDSYQSAQVRLLGDKIDVGSKPLNVPLILQLAQVAPSTLVAVDSYYSIALASPIQVAHILDAIFRHHFNIRPFSDGGNDYAVGAEWL
jgi:hypothetical protein